MYRTYYDEEAKLWSGCNVPPLYNPKISIGQVVLKSMRSYSSKVAQISDDSGVTFTFEDLRIRTIRVAQNLQKRGYTKKQVFGFVAENDALLTPVVFASWCMGCTINVLSTHVEKGDILRMFDLIKPGVMFCDISVYDTVVELLRKLGNKATVFTFNGTKGDSLPIESLYEPTGIEDEFIPVEVDGINDTAIILSSSGTTGSCKGVCVSHASIISNVVGVELCKFDDIIFSTAPLHWISSCTLLVSGTINGATRIITTKPFTIELQARAVEHYKATIAGGLPYQLILMLKGGFITKSGMSSVRRLLIGGGKVPPSLIDDLKPFLRSDATFTIFYGLTESGGAVAGAHMSTVGNKVPVGRLIDGMVMKIVDEEGNRCGINTNGEICIKYPYKFIGYYGDKELTDRVIDNEGFFLTGDIGHFEDGNLYIEDRKKDLIYHPDEHVSPTDIETVLYKSPEVAVACVVGIPEGVIEWPAAVIVRKEKSNVSEEDLCKLVENNLPYYCKLSGGVYFVDSIPTTATGKLLRRCAKEVAIKMYNERGIESTKL